MISAMSTHGVRRKLSPASDTFTAEASGNSNAAGASASDTSIFPQEVMDMIYGYMVSNIKIKPCPDANRDTIAQAGLGFLLVNKTQSKAFHAFMHECKYSLPNEMSAMLLLLSETRLDQIRHMILPAPEPYMRGEESVHKLYRLLFGALPGVETVEVVAKTAAWKKNYRSYRKMTLEDFEQHVLSRVNSTLPRCADEQPNTPHVHDSISFCLYAFLAELQKWAGSCSLPSSSLSLSVRRKSVGPGFPLPKRHFPKGLGEYSDRLLKHNVSSRHELISWHAIGRHPNVTLSVEGSMGDLRPQIDSAHSSMLRTGVTEEGWSLEPIYAIFHHVFLRPPTAAECLKMCLSDDSVIYTKDTMSKVQDHVLEYYEVFRRMTSRGGHRTLDKHESYRLWSFCFRRELRPELAANWEQWYDTFRLDGSSKDDSDMRDWFFQGLLGCNTSREKRERAGELLELDWEKVRPRWWK
jgi:hypothetical protein